MSPWMTVPGDWRRPSHREQYPLHWCRACLFGQLHPRPSDADCANAYDVESYYTHGNGAQAPQPSTMLDRLRVKLAWSIDRGRDLNVAWLRQHLGPPPRSVCDLGCGAGGLLLHARALGYAAVGVEPDAKARNIALAKGLTVHPGTAEDVPESVRHERFDCVIMSHVLEHCRDPRRAVTNAAALLNQDGLLVIETPNNASRGLAQAQECWPWLDVPRHVNFFTGPSLQSICQTAGLRPRPVEHCGYVRQFTPGWRNNESNIRDAFAQMDPREQARFHDNKASSPWKLLLSTLFTSEASKYDSVRVVADKTSA